MVFYGWLDWVSLSGPWLGVLAHRQATKFFWAIMKI